MQWGRRVALAAAIITAPGAAQGAMAAEETLDALQAADARCFAYSALLASKDDENMQAAGQTGMPYFLGKLTARDPDLDMEAMLHAAAKRIQAATSMDDAKRCGAEIVQRFAQIAEAGDALKASAE